MGAFSHPVRILAYRTQRSTLGDFIVDCRAHSPPTIQRSNASCSRDAVDRTVWFACGTALRVAKTDHGSLAAVSRGIHQSACVLRRLVRLSRGGPLAKQNCVSCTFVRAIKNSTLGVGRALRNCGAVYGCSFLLAWPTLLGCGHPEELLPKTAAQIASPQPRPEDCRSACDAVGGNDGAALLAPRAHKTRGGSLKVLVVTPAPAASGLYPDTRKLRDTLEGLGWTIHWAEAEQLEGTNLGEYAVAIFAGSSNAVLNLSDAASAKVVSSMASGLDALWLGNGLSASLEKSFGVQVVSNGSAKSVGITKYELTVSQGTTIGGPIFGEEWTTQVKLTDAKALAVLEPGKIPAVTLFDGQGDAGRAIAVPFGLTDFWDESPGTDGFGRAEVLFEILNLLTSRGNATLDSFPDGHAGAFIVRFEDINPGGTRVNPGQAPWLERYDRVAKSLGAAGIPLNLAVIPRYIDPKYKEDIGWDGPGEGRAQVLQRIKSTLAAGGEFVTHGYSHQFGTRDEDYSSSDAEFEDDTSGKWTFLSYDEQVARTTKARAEVERVFGIKGRTWETPHYQSNADTFRAAASSGFTVATEGDGHLFPNRWGMDNHVGDQLLNVPTTGSFIPYDTPADFYQVAVSTTLPRLVRMRAPFYVFYHGFLDQQQAALMGLASCASQCHLWSPTVSQFADWWESRARATLAVSESSGGDAMEVSVANYPKGAWVTMRLPDGRGPASVTIDGAAGTFQDVRRHGIAYARVGLPDGRTSSKVEIVYTP